MSSTSFHVAVRPESTNQLFGVVETALEAGRDPAEAVYKLAQKRGFKPGQKQEDSADEKLRNIEYGKKEAYAQTVALHMPRLLEIKRNSQSEHTKRFIDVCIADSEKRLGRSIKDEAGFHLEHNHLDAQNRQPWQDKDTGWKPRK